MSTVHRLPLLLTTLLLAASCSRSGQEGFSTPEAAFDALASAVEKNDKPALQQLLGDGVDELLDSGDAIQDAADRALFIKAYRARHAVQPNGDQRLLVVGDLEWPLPIPAVQRDGHWMLVCETGAEELVYRRVGENELGAMAVARGFVEAQKEYAAQGHDGDPAGIYAMKLVSDAGLQNGLYWETAENEPPSPAGAFLAAAASEGYRTGDAARTAGATTAPYHGYHYRMLFAQGSNANGGAREYFQDGLLTQGFALIAWPAEYGASGVMTFFVNQDGVVFQQDLGETTSEAVDHINRFDPDSSWQKLPDL